MNRADPLWDGGDGSIPTDPVRSRTAGEELNSHMVIVAPATAAIDRNQGRHLSKRFQNVTILCKGRVPLTSTRAMATVEQS